MIELLDEELFAIVQEELLQGIVRIRHHISQVVVFRVTELELVNRFHLTCWKRIVV